MRRIRIQTYQWRSVVISCGLQQEYEIDAQLERFIRLLGLILLLGLAGSGGRLRRDREARP